MVVQHLRASNIGGQQPLLSLKEQEEEVKCNSEKEGALSGETVSQDLLFWSRDEPEGPCKKGFRGTIPQFHPSLPPIYCQGPLLSNPIGSQNAREHVDFFPTNYTDQTPPWGHKVGWKRIENRPGGAQRHALPKLCYVGKNWVYNINATQDHILP